MVIENVTGWNELMAGNITSAAFVAINEPLGGMLILILYVLLSIILWTRTQSIELCTIMSFIFLGVFLVTPWFTKAQTGVVMVIAAFELGATIFKLIAKEKNY